MGRELPPARQGTFDGLCGVYAIVNAVDLLEPRPRRNHFHADLFVQLTHGLGAAALLASMDYGVTPTELARAAKFAFQWLAITYDVHLEISEPFIGRRFTRTRPFVRALGQYADPPHSVAVISLQRPGRSHWTSVRAIDGLTIRLRDSAGLADLEAGRFNIEQGSEYLRPTSTLAVSRVG